MFECVQICTVSDTAHALQRRRRHDLPPRGLSGIECRPVQRVQRPGVCALCLAWSALLPVLCRLSGCAGGWGLHRQGIQAAPGVGWVNASRRKNSKKAFSCLPTPSFLRKTPYPLLPILKIPRKNKKTPTKGLCSVLYLPYKP